MSFFTSKDLVSLLPDQIVNELSFHHSDMELSSFEGLKPKIDNSKKIVRYFPGKAPTWVESDITQKSTVTSEGSTLTKVGHQDRRLSRIENAKSKVSDDGVRKRRIFEAEIISEVEINKENESETEILFQDEKENLERFILKKKDDDLEEDIVSRRARIQERLALKKDETLNQSTTNFMETKADESESEYETDSDDDDENEQQLLKPLFIPRSKRETIQDYEKKQQEIDIKVKQNELRQDERKEQTRTLLAESLKRVEMRDANDDTDVDSDFGLPDDSDNLDDLLEYENWKLREIERIKIEYETRQRDINEKKEIEKRRNMTDEERKIQDDLDGKNIIKDKTKWKFLQKYYHKGGFYMDDESLKSNDKLSNQKIHQPDIIKYNMNYANNNKNEEIEDVRLKSFDEPTLEDKFNKDVLPSILQVKKFGFKGRTKYTHLVDQDTMTKDSYFNKLHFNPTSRFGGTGDLGMTKKRKKE